MPVEESAESASVKRGSDAAAGNEERARLRLRAAGKRGQQHDMQEELEPQAKTKARPETRRGQKRESMQSQIWRNRSRRQFLLRVAVLRLREVRSRVLTFLSLFVWLQA